MNNEARGRIKIKLVTLLVIAVVVAILASISPVAPHISISGQGVLSFDVQVALAAYIDQPPGRTISSSTHIFELADDTVEVGNGKTEQFEPYVRLNRWGDETWLTIKPSGNITEVGEMVKGDRIQLAYKVKQEEYELELESEFYTLPSDSQNESGIFELNIILAKKPPTNRLVFDIETQGLTFHYQPPLTQEYQDGWSDEFQREIEVTETQVWLRLTQEDIDTEAKLTPEEIAAGRVLVLERPENGVGSYAVYHATKQDHIAGQTDYKAGKAFHIYRPRIEDADGKWAWGELNVDTEKGLLTVTIPQDFLDTAKYPIRHAAGLTFGFTDIGISAHSGFSDEILGVLGTPANAGEATSITFYLPSHVYDDGPRKLGLYVTGDSSFVIGTAEYSGETPNAWVEHDLTTPTGVTVQSYVVVHWGEEFALKHDSVAGMGREDPMNYPSAWPNPAVFSTVLRKYSIYCTYAITEADISNTPSSKAFGIVDENTSYWSDGSAPTWPLDDGECYFTVTNNGDTCSITVKATNFTGGDGWTLTSGAPGSGTVRIRTGKSGDANEAAMVVLTTSEQAFISGLAGSGTKKWEMKLETGTFTDGVEKTSTITLTATLD